MSNLTHEEKYEIIDKIYDELDFDAKNILLMKLLKDLTIRLELNHYNRETGDIDKLGILDIEAVDILKPDSYDEKNHLIVGELYNMDVDYIKEIIKK
jgi:hypothetical protein